MPIYFNHLTMADIQRIKEPMARIYEPLLSESPWAIPPMNSETTDLIKEEVNRLSVPAQAELLAICRIGDEEYMESHGNPVWAQLIKSFDPLAFEEVLPNLHPFCAPITFGISAIVSANTDQVELPNSWTDMVNRIAQYTGHPYWTRAAESVTTVQVQPMKSSKPLQMAIQRYDKAFRATKRQCYFNSHRLAEKLNRVGVVYVEGLYIIRGNIHSHAWIQFDDGYYDPTLDPSVEEDKKAASPTYLAFHHCSGKDVRLVLESFRAFDPELKAIADPPAPFAPYLWNIPEQYRKNLNISHGTYQSLLMEFSHQMGAPFTKETPP